MARLVHLFFVVGLMGADAKTNPPTLPVAFHATLVRKTTYGNSPPEVSNSTLYLDLPKNKQYVADYTEGFLVQSWSLYNLRPPRLYTLDKQDLPPPGCICVTASPPLLPEFYDMSKADLVGHETIRGEECEKWIVGSEIIKGDSYIAWVKANTNVPLRTRWIDPDPAQNATIVETTDYYDFVNTAPPSAVFEPEGACKKVTCNGSKRSEASRRRDSPRVKWLTTRRT